MSAKQETYGKYRLKEKRVFWEKNPHQITKEKPPKKPLQFVFPTGLATTVSSDLSKNRNELRNLSNFSPLLPMSIP